MNYELNEICRRIYSDPEEYVAECDGLLDRRIRMAAVRFAADIDARNIVLLSGPSGSGKTTTAKLLERRLSEWGIQMHVISLDDYYRTVDPETHPRDSSGHPDFESPELLDIPLLTRHFAELSHGGEILIPKFDFTKQARDDSRATPLRVGANEMVIFEGIHALNPMLSGPVGGRAQKLYVSARSQVLKDGDLHFKGTWTRLIRRLIRDEKFRDTKAAYTMTLWAGVRRGEKRYISPYKESADCVIDSFLPYEICVLRPFALPLVETVPDHCPRQIELRNIHPRLSDFPSLDEGYIAHDALLREFIGGGSIDY